jgi:flagellar biogenesis protein FliO
MLKANNSKPKSKVMFKYYFERIQDIEIFPVISLLIFVLFFVSLLIWVVKADKKYIQSMEHLPLQEDKPGQEESIL